MSEQITVRKNGWGWVVVMGRETGSRLWFYAPGLEVYVKGESAAKQFDVIANLAMNEAQTRHIAPGSLKTAASGHNGHGGQKKTASAPVQQNLFPIEDIITKGDTDDTV